MQCVWNTKEMWIWCWYKLEDLLMETDFIIDSVIWVIWYESIGYRLVHVNYENPWKTCQGTGRDTDYESDCYERCSKDLKRNLDNCPCYKNCRNGCPCNTYDCCEYNIARVFKYSLWIDFIVIEFQLWLSQSIKAFVNPVIEHNQICGSKCLSSLAECNQKCFIYNRNCYDTCQEIMKECIQECLCIGECYDGCPCMDWCRKCLIRTSSQSARHELGLGNR